MPFNIIHLYFPQMFSTRNISISAKSNAVGKEENQDFYRFFRRENPPKAKKEIHKLRISKMSEKMVQIKSGPRQFSQGSLQE